MNKTPLCGILVWLVGLGSIATTGCSSDETAPPITVPGNDASAEVEAGGPEASLDSPVAEEAATDVWEASADVEVEAEASVPTIDWQSCDLVEGTGDKRAQCAYVPMPLLYDQDDGQTIEIYVKRVLSKIKPAVAQFWFVQGGPGGSSVDDMAPFVKGYSTTHNNFDFYLADHRGTGRSDRLGCKQEAQGFFTTEAVKACGEEVEKKWGAKLAGYTTTASAWDILHISEWTRSPGQKLFVYGASYGSYNVARMVQLAPQQISGAILDGIAPIGFAVHDFDTEMDKVAKTFFSRCAQDAFCSSKLGSDPWATYQKLRTDLEGTTHCPDFISGTIGLDRFQDLKVTIGSLLYSKWTSEHVPVLVYHLARCNAEDLVALEHYFKVLSGGSGTGADGAATGFASGLFYYLSASELWSASAPSQADLHTLFQQTSVATGVSMRVGDAFATWPKYKPDSFDDVWTPMDIPLLMTEGELDPATPLVKASLMKEHYKGPHQTFVSFEHAGHCVLGQTNLDVYAQTDCADILVEQFVTDPTASLDTSCVSQVLPLDFKGSEQSNKYYWGHADAWENSDTLPEEKVTSAQVALELKLQSIRRSLPKPLPRLHFKKH